MYIKINNTLYPAVINGRVADQEWDGRASKAITLEMSYYEATELFTNGLSWKIVDIKKVPVYNEQGLYVYDEEGNQVMEDQVTEYDNSEFNVAGDIVDHRNGMLTVKMGKLTDLEEAYEIILGGI